ncbi:hypothetical protein OG933_44710 [Streptomyces sp. NBC_00016]|uniref:hypothetical protein n=1 Tax=Streptomyces sp. NBC_00016 TaxID=2975622 RepID=UPI003250CB40
MKDLTGRFVALRLKLLLCFRGLKGKLPRLGGVEGGGIVLGHGGDVSAPVTGIEQPLNDVGTRPGNQSVCLPVGSRNKILCPFALLLQLGGGLVSFPLLLFEVRSGLLFLECEFLPFFLPFLP